MEHVTTRFQHTHLPQTKEQTILDAFEFTAEEIIEENGSVTLSLNEMDLVENGKDKETALLNLANGILEYSTFFCEDFEYWAVGKRKQHIPYVLKALMANDIHEIGSLIKCHPGEI